jgi:allantoin racemase
MRILFVNPNSTATMTAKIAAAARSVAAPGTAIEALTNRDGPPAIQGEADGEAALPGLLRLLAEHEARADAFVIACFDDTGLEAARRTTAKPVTGIGEAAFLEASRSGRFSVVTTLSVSVSIIEANIAAGGFGESCVRVRASEVPVLALEREGADAEERVAAEIGRAVAEDRPDAIVLGCAGMADLASRFTARFGLAVVDGVAAAVRLIETGRIAGRPAADEKLSDDARVVRDYLEASMVPDPDRAATYMAPGCTITFTGGRRFDHPSGPTSINAARYGWVKKRMERFDVAPAADRTVVYSIGKLYGEWPDGTPFDDNRYVDRFEVVGGRIVKMDVWNDSAEWILDPALRRP